MPRQPRYFIPGLPQHVVQRGVDRQTAFFAEADYKLYLKSLLTAARAHGCEVHAYVLMTNHTHLLLTPTSARAIPLVMQAIGRNYVQTINRLYSRTGPLWEGRYKASLVQDDAYLLSCYRYIELNPVRADMVRLPGDYPYSSYAHNAAGQFDRLITEHDVYRSLAANREDRLAAYRRLFADEFDPELLGYIRKSTHACQVMGDNRFKDRVEAMLGHSVRPGKTGRPRTRED